MTVTRGRYTPGRYITLIVGRLHEAEADFQASLAMTERLVDAFIDMAATSVRYDAYLQSVNVDALEDDRKGPAFLGRLAQARQELVHGRMDRLLEDLLARAEVEVDRSLGHARFRRDLLHGGAREPLSPRDPHGGLADRAAAELLDDLLLRRGHGVTIRYRNLTRWSWHRTGGS